MTWRWKASVVAEASSPSYSRKCGATQLIASRLPVGAYSPREIIATQLAASYRSQAQAATKVTIA